MQSVFSFFQTLLPDTLDAVVIAKFAGILLVAVFLIGFIGRFAFGKRSALNYSVSSAIGILFMYAIFVVITIFCTPLSVYLSPLPFIEMDEEYLYVFPIFSAEFASTCSQILGILILAFIINLLDSYLPDVKKLVGWFLRNIAILALSFLLYGIAAHLINQFAPQVLLTWAPVVLLAILVFLLLLSILKVLFGVAMAAVNPVIASIYTFFFAHKIGKLFSKAIFTTILITLIVVLMNWLGFTAICILTSALIAYIHFALILLAVWYILGKLL